jgi:hypothetical protein
VVVEGALADAEDPGDGADAVRRVGQQAGHDDLSDEFGEGGEEVEDHPTAGCGGVEGLMQRGEPDPAFAEFADHGDQVLQGPAVADAARYDEGVAGLKESVAGLKLWPGRVLSGFLVREHAAAGSGRTAVLLGLTTRLPAAALARLLGISHRSAARWVDRSGNAWANYAAELQRTA